ncbi:Reverse transcriptase domain-containing protein [Aphis craccivora]|uniref:Reverse transcriptase domain-containing protein n=1 Tax=Aphis craccivora TaxID=307492 RepID=A0A6G0XS86_APHCR|nr:Reverse transcriptase domain-containing protein [Aphis craccivora]
MNSITTCIMLPATSETSVLELGKWTKPMLIDFILNKTLPSDLKVSDSLLSHLNTNNLEPESSDNTANVATILQSVNVSRDTFCQAVKHVPIISLVPASNRVDASDRPKFIVGSGIITSSVLSAAPTQKFFDLFVSRLNPTATADLLKSKLFSEFEDITVTRMVTKHPTYASFHIHLPLDKLQDVLEPSFWPDGVIFKRFWGRLLGMILDSKNSKN